ncbi:MAG TPA: FKBP-type peptidyl-prolyl cis-trans isomerase [Paludibacter sp.]|nr:FKBP-type peptidyl-prolyl cis-trans isomerase [Paludibacter sp.]
MKKTGFLLVLCLCAGFYSCKKQAPQIPSNKVVVDNTEAKTLLDINQNLALKEDSLLEIFAKKKDKSFIKNEIGFWYKIELAGSGPKVTDKSTCNFSYKLTLLNGKTLEEGKKQVVIGKKQIVAGLEAGLKMLHHGDSATFIIPWYLGYGMNGNKPLVLPYTSIIYQIKLDN